MGSSFEKIIIVQYLRGIAACLVVLYHVTMMSAVQDRFLVHTGQFGVDIFFVISGFVMWTTAGDKTPVSFWIARIWRIVPLYWLTTAAFVLAAALLPGLLYHARDYGIVFIIKSFLFVAAENPGVGDISPIYTIGWTLNYEMFFYFIFGLTLFLKSRATRLVCLFVVFISLVIIGRQPQSNALATFYTSPIILEFLAGVLFGVLSAQLQNSRIIARIVLVVSIPLMIGSSFMAATDMQRFMMGISAAGVVAGSLSLEHFVRRHSSASLRLIGDASYSIYLVHPLFQRAAFIILLFALGNVDGPLKLTIYSIVTLIAGIAGGIVTYFLIEKPILGLRAKSRSALALPQQVV